MKLKKNDTELSCKTKLFFVEKYCFEYIWVTAYKIKKMCIYEIIILIVITSAMEFMFSFVFISLYIFTITPKCIF